MKLNTCLLICALAFPASVLAQTAKVWQEPQTGMPFVSVPAGCYAMGIPEKAFTGEGGVFLTRLRSEMPQHKVCLDHFWIAQFEVTEADWLKVMGNPQNVPGSPLPMTQTTWQAAVDFAARLTEQAEPGTVYRLPTEAEWEYACRAGAPAETELKGGDQLADKAWFSYHYAMDSIHRHHTPQPVGTRQANGWGIHDMLGNAWEWTTDSYDAKAYAMHSDKNPVVTGDSPNRVIRGGSFRTARHFVRCEARAWHNATDASPAIGFRLVRVSQGGEK